MVAPAIGPTLGGWLVTSVSWHWIFLINVPIGVVTLIAGIRLLPDVGHREARPFDGLGLVLGGGGLAVIILGIAQGPSWGWASAPTAGCLTAGAVMLALFVRHELRRPHPLLDLRMFQQRSFRLAMIVMAFIMGAQYARLVFVPLQLESLRGYSAMEVGLMFIVPAIATAIAMSISGRMVDQIGPRTPVMIGCGGMVVAMGCFSQLTLTTPAWVIVVLLSIQGLSMGLTMSPAMVAGLSDLPARLGRSGLGDALAGHPGVRGGRRRPARRRRRVEDGQQPVARARPAGVQQRIPVRRDRRGHRPRRRVAAAEGHPRPPGRQAPRRCSPRSHAAAVRMTGGCEPGRWHRRRGRGRRRRAR